MSIRSWESVYAASLLRSLACSLLLAAAEPARAAEPTEQPLPQLETGMHTANIRGLATDRQGRWAVTASEDKTARVWDVASHDLLAVLRPPQDVGDEGKLYSVAMSPDGETVALGGWTTGNWKPSESGIYLFDRRSARLLAMLGPVPDVVNRMAYSPDGRRLAVISGHGELQIFDVRSRQRTAFDTHCKIDSYGVQFNADGRQLLTTCLDGMVRLYAVDNFGRLSPPRAGRTVGGQKPHDARWSPDNRLIAVGFLDSPAVQVLNADTLLEVARPNVAGMDNGGLSSVSWSADGHHLLAGGTWYAGGKKARHWAVGDWSRYTDWLLDRTQTLTEFVPLPGGGWLFATAFPAWGQVTHDGRVMHRQDPATGDLSGAARLQVSADGQRVRYSLQWSPELGRTFDLPSRRLGPNTSDLQAPRIQADGLRIERWGYLQNDEFPLLNGKPLALDKSETSLSLAIAGDGQTFALGTGWSLRLFDRQGQLLWRQAVPEVAWAVNLTADQRHLVAAYGDGTIRWHSLARQGAEVLAFFPHADGQRWVAWTPEGFYAASDDSAEGLMGYHLNRGASREGEFISARQLREHFFQPNLISQRLTADGDRLMANAVAKLGDVRQLLAGAKAPPPKVELLGLPAATPGQPGDLPELSGNEEVTVQVRVTNQGGGIGRLNFYVDGQLQQGRQAGMASDGTETRTFALPPGRRARIEVSATNASNIVESARQALWGTVTGPVQDGALHIFAVGVQRYQDSRLDLGHSAADAESVSSEIASRARPLFKRGVFVAPVLLDSQASLDGLERGFAALKANIKPQDTLVIFLAGHGEAPIEQGYTFLPWDFRRGAAGPAGEGLNEKRLRNWLAQSPGQTLLLIDTCDAGGAVTMFDGAYERLSTVSRKVLIGASRQGELAKEGYQGHGVFTAALLRVLGGKPADGDEPELGVVRLRADVESEVRRIQRELNSTSRQRVSGFLGSANFPLVRR